MLPPKTRGRLADKGPAGKRVPDHRHAAGAGHVIGSVKRNYELLPADHPAMKCLEDCLKLDGFDVIMRVREFYA